MKNHKFLAIFKKTNVNFLLEVIHLPRQRCELELSRLQQAKHSTGAKQFVNWDWSVFKYSDTKCSFLNSHFLDPGRKK